MTTSRFDVEVDPGARAPRRRRNAAGDVLWPVATAERARFQRAAADMATSLNQRRGRVSTLASLVEAEQKLTHHLSSCGLVTPAHPGVLTAARAVHADGLVEFRKRERCGEAIDAARAAEAEWFGLARTPACPFEMNLARGHALITMADSHLGEPPYRLTQAVLETETGDTLVGCCRPRFRVPAARRIACRAGPSPCRDRSAPRTGPRTRDSNARPCRLVAAIGRQSDDTDSMEGT